ncbi:hypothetical protein [Pleurocapsa sp. PCC 7319]|uniref:hypothetical protein n=1 Tax=Pleurocapsa sp. PCC 7319 TaxID=118161 RepID=UPI000346FD89|nr:hypothetical protein [Pleurocapsa sp. PCC 7319]
MIYPGDRAEGIVTIANRWGSRTAFVIAWVLLGMLMFSIPIALLLLPMVYPWLFVIFSPIVLLSLAIALIRYQQQRSLPTYQGLILWGRLGMLLGVIGLIGAAAPL